MNALAKALETVKEAAKAENKQRDEAFLGFAYVVYENSPLLNGRGLTFAEFAEALGYSAEAFGEGKIKEIKEKL